MHLCKEGLKIRLGQTCLPAIAAFTLLAPLSALTADGEPELLPQCGGPFQLCGYVEKGSGVERTPQQFEVAAPFSAGLAAVRIEGRYGFIDASGKIVIPPRFQNAGPFAGEYAEVRLDNASGIINRSGEWVVAPQFKRIVPFSGETFIAQPFVNIANKRGELRSSEQLEAITDSLSLSSHNDSGLFHAQKGWLTAQNLMFSIFDKPERGLIWAENRSNNYNRTWGLIRADGSWQVTPRYDEVLPLTGARAEVLSTPDLSLPFPQRREVQRWGAVDRDGKLVIPLKFVFLRFWRGEYGIAMDAKPDYSSGMRSGGREALVRADGTLLADRYFDKVETDEKGDLPRGRIGKTWYRIEPNGRMIPEHAGAEKLQFVCPGGLTIVQRGESVEFRMPGQAQPIGVFDNGYFHRSDCKNGIRARRDGKSFIAFEDGSLIGGKDGYESTYSFFGNHTAVQVDGKWGIIDRSDAFTVTPSFAQLRPDREGIFVVNEKEDPYWINAYGKRIEKPTSAWLTPAPTLNCEGGLRFFEKAGLWGLQDSTGKTVIEPRFRALSCFQQGITWTAAPGGKGWCPTGPNGQKRDSMECREEYYPTTWSESRPEKFSDDPYESNVLWNRAWLDYQAGKRDKLPEWISGWRLPSKINR